MLKVWSGNKTKVSQAQSLVMNTVVLFPGPTQLSITISTDCKHGQGLGTRLSKCYSLVPRLSILECKYVQLQYRILEQRSLGTRLSKCLELLLKNNI